MDFQLDSDSNWRNSILIILTIHDKSQIDGTICNLLCYSSICSWQVILSMVNIPSVTVRRTGSC